MQNNNFNDLKKHDIVKIIAKNEWNGLYGIVDEINYKYKIAYIFCNTKPNDTYIIKENNIDDINIIKTI